MRMDNFEDLEVYLENWVNFHGDGGYDFNGALNLLSAILRNMKKNSLESDFDVLNDFFDKSELDVLKLICEKSKQY